MRLSTEEFTAWSEGFYERASMGFAGNANWIQIAKDAPFTDSRLSVQRSREVIDALAIINISRTYDVNPLPELARIPQWEPLTKFPLKPSNREVLSSLHLGHILRELADRMDKAVLRHSDLGAWDSYYGRFSTWFDVAGSEAAKLRLREAIKIGSASAMSSRLNSHIKFGVDEILDGFMLIGVNPVYALVLAGHITDEEAGYSATLRQDVLRSVIDEDFSYMCQKQMRYTTKILAQHRDQKSAS